MPSASPPAFRDPAFLRRHMSDIVAFYHPRCLDAEAGGYFNAFRDDGSVYDPATRHLVGWIPRTAASTTARARRPRSTTTRCPPATSCCGRSTPRPGCPDQASRSAYSLCRRIQAAA